MSEIPNSGKETTNQRKNRSFLTVPDSRTASLHLFIYLAFVERERQREGARNKAGSSRECSNSLNGGERIEIN